MLPSTQDLIETFEALDDWESRYAYLIDLGRALPPMEESLRTDEVLVRGCTSRVWLIAHSRTQADGTVLYSFTADSDAAIVKGLVAVVLTFAEGRSAVEIAGVDMQNLFDQLKLGEHLTPNRRSGFFAFAQRVRQLTGGTS